MDEDRNRKDAALSHSDGGPLKSVRDPGGHEIRGPYPQERKCFEGPFAASKSD